MIHFIVRLSAKFLYTVCLIFHASIRSTVKEEQNLSGSFYCRRFAIKQGCCLTGARSPEAPKFCVGATKFWNEEPTRAPNQ